MEILRTELEETLKMISPINPPVIFPMTGTILYELEIWKFAIVLTQNWPKRPPPELEAFTIPFPFEKVSLQFVFEAYPAIPPAWVPFIFESQEPEETMFAELAFPINPPE